jgi:hypothetical protein
VLEDLKAWGAPPEEIERWRRQLQQEEEIGDVIELPLDCVRVMDLFFAVETQWKTAIAGERLVYFGLDYPGVREAVRFLRLRPSAEEFALLQLMEREVIDAKAGAAS